MSQLPTYQIEESALVGLKKTLAEVGVRMLCTKPEYLQRDNVPMYPEWEVKSTDGVRLIMWGKRPNNRPTNSSSLELTLGSPDGKRGLKHQLDFQATNAIIIIVCRNSLRTGLKQLQEILILKTM